MWTDGGDIAGLLHLANLSYRRVAQMGRECDNLIGGHRADLEDWRGHHAGKQRSGGGSLRENAFGRR